MRRRLRAYADEIFPLANDAVEFVTMLLLNKHYVEHSHVPTLHGQRKKLMHLVNHFYPEDDSASVMAKAHKKTNAIHSAFMGREHPLFHGGVVTKAVGVCVDGCQYQIVRCGESKLQVGACAPAGILPSGQSVLRAQRYMSMPRPPPTGGGGEGEAKRGARLNP